MAKDMLLEIGTEEIPARFMGPALAQLKELTFKLTEDLRLDVQSIASYGTPRRLVVYINGLAEQQRELLAEVKGPAKKAAFNEHGEPTKAAEGFAKSQGVAVKDLTVKSTDGGEYLYALKKESGVAINDILPGLCQKIINGLNFPKPMRWGNKEMRFARPIRWILALYGEEVIPFEIEELASGKHTRGHRFLSAGNLEVRNPQHYFQLLAENYVMVDQQKRRQEIWRQVQELAHQEGGLVKADDELLEEVTQLLEYPTALCGNFDQAYLKLPEEVIITPMREHQRYFPVSGTDGKLLNKFITVRNGTDKFLDIVKEGNEKVLRARLADAKFFYEEDLKTSLEDNVERLEKIVFQESLGSVYEKVERIISLSEYLTDEFGLTDLDAIDKAKRAAYLCKADLVSNMVYEFPELQGIMGKEYARYGGEPAEVAEAIFEHYLPRFAGDILPQTPAGMMVSIADKIDTIVGCFAIGIQPTGSQDPYALRRQALGICHIILEGDISISLPSLITQAFNGYEGKVKTKLSLAEVQKEVGEFFKQRLKNIFTDRGLRYDTIDAILDAGYDNFVLTWQRAEALSSMRGQQIFDNLIAAFTRVNNLAKKATGNQVNQELFIEPAEVNLWTQYNQVREKTRQLEHHMDFKGILNELAKLQQPIDIFFNDVMVMDKDERIKHNRLGLLTQINQLILRIADLSKIQQNV